MDLRDALQRALGDGYTVERELGGGGMSRVFLALDLSLGRRIVAKVLAPDLAAGVNRERFEREVLLAAQLQHPNIVTVLGAGVIEDLPYYTMPFVAGESLRAAIGSRGALPAREAVGILRDTARALAFAHGNGVVHRDIKPDNVLLAGGAAMVTDFGVAKALAAGTARAQPPAATDSGAPLTSLGTSLGTLAYMAPEQAAADPGVDHRADLYSFGAMAYEMLAGKAPFSGLPPRELLTAIVAREPARLETLVPDLPPALVALVHRCLAKAPEDRPATAEEVLAALDGVFTGTAAASIARPSRGARAPLVAAGVALLLLGGWWALRRGGEAIVVPPNSLVVLPFTLAGASAEDGYFADGITEELTTALSRVPALRVTASASAFAVRDRAGDLRAVTRELGVANALTGSVRRGGDKVRVTVQLTSASDGLVRWAETYEREVKDVFAVQEEIGRSIAAALQVAFAPSHGMGAAATGDMAAYDLYLKGRHAWRQRGEASLRVAADYFSQAIARDSNFARAWAGLADAAGLLPVYGPTPVDSVLPIVERAAARALALDSTLADAHAARGQLYKSIGRWADAEAAFHRALATDSTHASAWQWLGELQVSLGRAAEAVGSMERARALDPMSPIVHGELGYIRAMAGQHDSALASGRRALELAPGLWTGHAFLGSVLLWQGDLPAAVLALDEAMRLAPQNPFGGVLVNALARAGDTSRARAMVTQLAGDAGRGQASPATVAIGYIGLGARGEALDWLERAFGVRDGMLYATPLNAPWFAPVWAEPRFARLREQMGLSQLPPPPAPR